MTNGKPVRLSTMIAPIGHGTEERIEEQRRKLRDTELEMEEFEVSKAPAMVSDRV